MTNQILAALSIIGVMAAITGSAFAADFPQSSDQEEVPVVAGPGVKIGILNCSKEPGVGYVIGSAKNLDCVYTSLTGEKGSDLYTGQIVKVGADIGFTNEGTLVWGVYAPVNDLANHKLDGTYVGVQAEANVIIGGGINVLSGSFNNSYNLVPLSVSSGTGLNVAGGLGAITLSSVE